jgi:CO/xanthine dehydrogenase FAD-binding subunit
MPYEPPPPVATPRTLDEAYGLLADDGQDWRPVAGGTDLLVAITGELGPPPARVLDLWRLDELRGVAARAGVLSIGALTTYTQLRRSDLVMELSPALGEAAATIGAAQIQNRGTIGGNIANASPAGDTLPVLLALDATIVVGGVAGERSIGAADFWPAYRTTALGPGELVLRVEIPIVDGRQARFRKVGTRRAQAISKVVVCLAWTEAQPGTAWRDVRLGLGSVAATPVRATATEAVLEGGRPDEPTTTRAAGALAAEISPIDDVRSTAEYRRAAASRVLARILRDEGGW